MFQHLEKDLFNTGPQSTGTLPRKKSNHSMEDVKILDKMTELSFGNQEDQCRLMDSAKQPNTSNETQNSDVSMEEVRIQTPVSRPIRIKDSQPEDNDGAPKNKLKRKARDVEVKDTQNIHSSLWRPLTLNGDSSSNEIPLYSPSRAITSKNLAAFSSSFNPSNENGVRDVQIQTEEVISTFNSQDDTEKNKYDEKNRILRRSLEDTLKEADELKKKNAKGLKIIRELLIEQNINERKKEYIKKEDAEIAAEQKKLEREKQLHIREIKRVQHEDDSIFNKHPIQKNDRYLLLTLLGKGGFSEVWRAYDLDSYRIVACKIHRVNRQWIDQKKASFVKHAIREKDIHKTLEHPNIVKMYDMLIIDQDTFCTILEYCNGNDLDHYLNEHGYLTEKETRLVIGQVVDALRYLSDRTHPVIHYDLKPANILLQSGCRKFEVKITDFGLSKQMETIDDCDSIELTSQGAGTYWYLPPETFKDAKISTKVDVWSVGIICYQCIYGKRPFGHDQTQRRILYEGTILKATVVNFPTKPIVSQIAQDFIRKCLQYEPSDRADALELSRHDFVKSVCRRIVQQPASPSSR
uniref:Protein kinase domain-containing protein n=1 Tax=Panagrolaimus davidi TaxID=227884 RepID=A0A914R7L5_9BILA